MISKRNIKWRAVFAAFAAALAAGAFAAAPALAGLPPVVTTTAATSITKTGATVNGTVNPEGLETKYYFEYGATLALGSNTAEASAGSGSTPVEVSKALTGLTENKLYYYRIAATNSAGKALTAKILTFTPATLPQFHELATGKLFAGGSVGTQVAFGREAEVVKFKKAQWEGEITGPSEVKVRELKFTEPLYGLGEHPCLNGTEVLKITGLIGRLGYINKAKKEIGLILEPKTQPFVKCENSHSGPEEYTGSVIGKVEIPGESSFSHEIAYKQEKGKQFITKFEGEEVIHSLEWHSSGGFSGPLGLWLPITFATTTKGWIE